MRFLAWGKPFCLVLAVLIACPHLSVAAKNKAEIADIKIDKTGQNLAVSFHLEECFTPKMEEAIQNGVSTTFRILVAIEKPSILVWKAQVLDFTLEHTIKYNRLNNEFQVHLPEHPEKVLMTKDFEEAKRWMSTVDNLPIIPTCWLHKNQEYSLKVKAELSKVELPLFFRYILFWVSLWDFETDWQKVAFQMQP
ncbi:MAG: DUF4390 domain-containing protein [Desulfobacteraceae bacterium]|nr:DUF4390 domain-containing protein [Desulfobacteraceae bacterium]